MTLQCALIAVPPRGVKNKLARPCNARGRHSLTPQRVKFNVPPRFGAVGWTASEQQREPHWLCSTSAESSRGLGS